LLCGGGRIACSLGGWNRLADWLISRSWNRCRGRSRPTAAYPQAKICQNVPELAREATAVFLAVHPLQVFSAAASLAGELSADTLIVSLAPKVTMRELSELLPDNRLLARFLPMLVLIGQDFPLAHVRWDQHSRPGCQLVAIL
jgi:hypothetical protein